VNEFSYYSHDSNLFYAKILLLLGISKVHSCIFENIWISFSFFVCFLIIIVFVAKINKYIIVFKTKLVTLQKFRIVQSQLNSL